MADQLVRLRYQTVPATEIGNRPQPGDCRKIDMSTEHNPIRILIADEQPSFRRSLRTALESEGDVEVMSDVAEASAALRLVSELKPDILLVDLALARQFESQGPNGFGTHSTRVRV